jgi:hypothetical protein
MKRKKGGVKAPLLPKLGDVAHLHPKATKKKNSSSPFVETWRQHHWYPKATK